MKSIINKIKANPDKIWKLFNDASNSIGCLTAERALAFIMEPQTWKTIMLLNPIRQVIELTTIKEYFIINAKIFRGLNNEIIHIANGIALK